jgi:DNA-binding response OmpR family regulator
MAATAPGADEMAVTTPGAGEMALTALAAAQTTRTPPGADGTPSAGVLCVDELEIRQGDGLVLAAGQPLVLSVREFELLVAMAARIGAILTRAQLYATVWGGELQPGNRSVDVYVSKLRSKLESAMPDRRFIHTHPGFGYRFQAEASRPRIERARLRAPAAGTA